MKSERAKETLNNSGKYEKKYRSIQGCQPIEVYVLLQNAELAVERAEEDARKYYRAKASFAFCRSCVHKPFSCRNGYTDICPAKETFLRNYDHE
jgi:hypothetical protein